MKSLSKLFAVLAFSSLVLTSGCVVMDPAEEAEYVEAEWADELLDEAEDAELEGADLEEGEGASDQGYETMDEIAPKDFPDPFNPTKPNDGNGG
jgi:hypothetical protein